MLALIIAGGRCPNPAALSALASGADLIVAADSGLDSAHKAGLRIDLAVGDFDSLSDRSLLDILDPGRVREFPAAKDETDTEIAIRAALERGASRLLLAGAGGGRLDHTLAIYSLFVKGYPLEAWYTGEENVFYVKKGNRGLFSAGKGNLVSVFPLSCPSEDMSSTGLRWSLNGLVWSEGQFGISNIVLRSPFSISAGNSDLLAILPETGERLE